MISVLRPLKRDLELETRTRGGCRVDYVVPIHFYIKCLWLSAMNKWTIKNNGAILHVCLAEGVIIKSRRGGKTIIERLATAFHK